LCAEGGATEASTPDTDGSTTDVVDSDGGARADGDADAAITYTGNHIWSKLFGSNASSSVSGAAVATDSAGNVFVTGTLTGSADFGGGVLTSAGGGDVYVAKFTKDGLHLWSKRFGDASGQGANNLAVDGSGNVFIGGNLNGTIDFGGGGLTSLGASDLWVAKFDANGNHVWSKSFGDATFQNLGGLAVLGSDVVLIGANAGSIDFGGGALTGRNYLARLGGASGAHVWSKQSTSGAGFVPRALATDPAGNVVGAGSLGSTVDWGAGALTTAGNDDVLVIKFDSSGNTLWNKHFGATNFQNAKDVQTNAAGDIFLTGDFSGALDFGVGAMTNPNGAGTVYVARLDKNGVGVWSKVFPIVDPGSARSTLAVDIFGNVAIAGDTSRAIDFGGGPLPCTDGTNNIFIAKFDGSGKHIWSKGWASGGGGSDSATALAFDPSGNMLMSGVVESSKIDLGGGPLTSVGAGDLLLAKFAP